MPKRINVLTNYGRVGCEVKELYFRLCPSDSMSSIFRNLACSEKIDLLEGVVECKCIYGKV